MSVSAVHQPLLMASQLPHAHRAIHAARRQELSAGGNVKGQNRQGMSLQRPHDMRLVGIFQCDFRQLVAHVCVPL